MARESFGSAKEKLYWAIEGAITAANRDVEYAHLAGVEGEAGPSPYLELKKMLGQGIRDVRHVERHTHKWGENDYCQICGADGRA